MPVGEDGCASADAANADGLLVKIQVLRREWKECARVARRLGAQKRTRWCPTVCGIMRGKDGPLAQQAGNHLKVTNERPIGTHYSRRRVLTVSERIDRFAEYKAYDQSRLTCVDTH